MNALPRLELEPPPGYVAFVARNLDTVREEATRMAGDEQAADRLYPDALTDVAMRWGWLELQRRWMHRLGVAEEYLSRALARRWQAEVARAERERAEEPEGPPVDIRVLRPDEPPPRWVGAGSAAVRLAPQVAPTVRPTFGPVADAAIAWWHAYETRRRRRWIALGAVVCMMVLTLARLEVNVNDAGLVVLLGTGWLRDRAGLGRR